MAFIPVTQVAETVIKHTLNGLPVFNVLNWFRDSAISQADLDSLAAALVEAWTGAIVPFLSTALTFDEVSCRDLTTQDSLTSSGSPAAIVNGGAGGDSHPANVALCMTQRTNRIGRSRRGRTYFGGLPETATSGNFASPTFATNLKTGFDSVKADLFLNGWQLVVVSRFANKVPRLEGLSTIVTDSLFINLRVDSQRNRLPD